MGTRRSWHPRGVQEGFAQAPSLDNIATRPYPGHNGRMDSGGSARNSEKEGGPSQPRTAKRTPDGQKRPPEESAKKTPGAADPTGPRRDGRR